ncbi:MAG: hypothetical protein HFG31_06470 [Eubacterium sp.]|nr:hypothetical protein [Eubacterium sp.]
MRNVMKKLIMIVLTMVLIVSVVQVSKTKVKAADGTVKIFLGNSTTPRHHKAVALGEETEELSFSVKNETVKSSSYTSNNPASFKIKNTTEGKCIVETVSEGTGLVTLTVKTKEGNTYNEKLFISVYKRIGNYSGIANKNTDVYRGATADAGVENEDDKGDIKKGTKFSVRAACGSFYLIKTLDGTVYADNLDTGFVRKKDIDILADSIKINEDHNSVKLNDSIKLSTTINSSITTNKNVRWSSSNNKVATIDTNGKIIAKSEGTVSITATTEDGTNKKDSIYVSVYSGLNSLAGFLNTDSKLYKVANDKIVRGSGIKGNTLTIVGQCDKYYRVKMDVAQFADGSNDKYCYVLKCNVDIYPTKVSLNYNSAIMYPNQKLKFVVSVTPKGANQSIKWQSKNPDIVSITGNEIKALKGGETIIIGTTINGKSVQCKVKVCVPMTGITIKPNVLAVEKGKTGQLKISCIPAEQIYNTINWQSLNNKIATVNKGKVKGGKTENTVKIKVTATPLKPTLGKQRNSVSNTALISVYTKVSKKFYVSPHNADIEQYIAATTNKTYMKSKKIKQNKLLKVIGTCGKFYYVEYANSKVFVLKSKVQEVELHHKELAINQTYTPKNNEKKAKKIIRNETSENKKGKTKTVYKTTVGILKGKNIIKKNEKEGTITAIKRGVCFLRVKQVIKKYVKNKLQSKETKTLYYRIHIVAPKKVGNFVGYTKKETQVYHCASTECPTRQISKNKKVLITGKVDNSDKSMLQIEYTQKDSEGVKKTYNGYVYESDIGYISVPSVVMSSELVSKKAKSVLKTVSWHINKEERKITEAKAGKSIIKAKKKDKSSIQISGVKDGNAMKTGCATLTVKAEKYISYSPVTVYTQMKHYQGYVRKEVKLKNGGSDNEHCSIIGILPKNSKLTILGQVGKYFYVKIEDKNIGAGTKGFVLKESVVYIDVDKQYVSVNKDGKYVKVNIKYYNAISVDVSGTNKNVGFIGKEATSIINAYKNNQKKGIIKQVTRQYYIIPKKEGTANIKLINGPLKFSIFVSSYTGTGKIEAFINKNKTSRFKCANEKLPKTNPDIVNRYDGCTIIGKIGNDWRYVERSGKRFWTKESRLTYLTLDWYNKEMYRYHSANHKAYLENSSDDKNISISLSDKSKAKIKKTVYNSNSKEVEIFADKPTKNNLIVINASYNYGKGTIHRKAYLKIKDIKIIINPKKKNLEIEKTKALKGNEIKDNLKYPKMTINAKIETLKNEKVKWSVSPKKSANIKVDGNKIVVEARKNGTIKVVAKYRDLKATCTLNVKTKTMNKFLSENQEYLEVLKRLMDCSLEICDGNVKKANDLVFQYMREGKYGSGIWKYATGEIDSEKVAELRKKLNRSGFFANNIYSDGFGNGLDIRHLCASINTVIYDTPGIYNFASSMSEEEIDLAGTTVGDYASGIGNYYAFIQQTKRGSSFKNMKELYFFNKKCFPNMSSTDILEDIDAYNISQLLIENSKLTFFEAFVKYYSNDVKTAKNKYFSQYEDEIWKEKVNSTLSGGNVKELMVLGATEILGDKFDFDDFYVKISIPFIKDASDGFKEFITKIYGGCRE